MSQLLLNSDNKDLQDVTVAAKIEKLTAELQDDCDVVQRITDGFFHFKINHFEAYPDYYEELADGQQPEFLVFACSDSRVSPCRVLNFVPGEAFTVRNIANMVPAFNKLKYSGVGAAIEYAVVHLKVENVLVIGHSKCGGIQALMSHPCDGSTSNDIVDEWVKMGLPAKAKVESKWGNESMEQKCAHCERESVNLSLVNALSYPYVRSRAAKKALKLMGGHYDVVNGCFELWKADFDVNPPIKI